DAAGQHGREGRDPRDPVEALERRRGEDLLAVARAERCQDGRLVLAACDALGDLLLDRVGGGALTVVARVDGESAPALTGERLLHLVLCRRRDGTGRDRQERRAEQRCGETA